MEIYPITDNTFAQAKGLFEGFRDYVLDPHLWVTSLLILGKIIVIWLAGRLASKILKKTIEHMMQERQRNPLKFDPRRTKTIGRLIGNILTYTINFFVIILVLYQLGFYLGPLLAGAGVLGLAVGFGAQSLVKDVITGFFIIFEDQFAVGDTIQIANYKGTVEEIGIRITRIRSWTGELFIIPNGTIKEVTNFSLHNSIAVVDMSIAYEENFERAIDVMKETVAILYEDQPDIVNVPDVLGVQNLGPSEVVIRVTAECRPNMAGPVSRVIRAELKKALDNHRIEIPYPKVVNISRGEKVEA